MSVQQTACSSFGSETSRSYVVVRPNLSADAAKATADRLLVEIAQQEKQVIIEMPGDTVTQPRDVLALAGTGTDFDGTWVITSVDRRITFERGFTQVIEARIPAWTAS